MELATELASRLERRGDLVAGAVFGSRGAGRARPDSDLDVAVLPASTDGGLRLRLQSEIAADLADLAPGGRVDVVLLDEVPELLRQRVFETGTPLFGAASAGWRALRILTMREHGDREHYRDLLRRGMSRRLLEARPDRGTDSDGRSMAPLLED